MPSNLTIMPSDLDLAKMYLKKKRAWVEIIALLPCYYHCFANPWMRLNRILYFFVSQSSVNRLVGKIHFNINTLRILNLLCTLGTWMHIVACITMILIWHQMEEAGEELTLQWIDLEPSQMYILREWRATYLHSQYYAFTHITGWGGEWSPQTPTMIGWTLANQIVGVFLYMVHALTLASLEPVF